VIIAIITPDKNHSDEISVAELDYIQQDTGTSPDACIIWLHGLGADGSDFVPIVKQLSLPAGLQLRFIFPHAPLRPITINQGCVMPGWYDIASADIVAQEDCPGIEASSAAIEVLIEQQISAGIAPGRILLAGFSQGGVIALHCGLRRSAPEIGGIIALSCYLPGCAQLRAGHELSLFLAHGARDPVIAIARGRESYKRLERAGYSAEWHEYEMEHSVCGAEVADLRRFLLSCFGLPEQVS
jgi:phospholipase/carboxylesterase